MKHKIYGRTGERVSILGFGGMRFENPSDLEASADTVLHAFHRGINYFDTAPIYCDDKSEDIMGLAIEEMKKSDRSFYISSKSSHSDGGELREQLERSLRRLNVDAIDFYHCWYLSSLNAWERRKSGGAVRALQKAKEEGLVRHIVFSTHMPGEHIRKVIEEDIFEGVLLGYSAMNFLFREEGIRAATEYDMGVVVMNPLGGGLIPANAQHFEFLKIDKNQSVVDAALQFLWSHRDITVTLVGFRNKSDVDAAVNATEGVTYSSEQIENIKSQIKEDFNKLCTSCMYCRECPEGIEVWKFVETANSLYLKSTQKMADRLKYHWMTDIEELDKCTHCKECEEVCTQHLPILERFEWLKRKVREELRAYLRTGK